MDNNELVEKKNTKLVSTIILLIILALSLIVFFSIMAFDFKAVVEATSNSAKENAENAGERIAGGFAVALTSSIILVLMLGLAFILVIVDIICLIKAINNRKSSIKWIKIMSFVLDGSFGLILLLTVIRVLTWLI